MKKLFKPILFLIAASSIAACSDSEPVTPAKEKEEEGSSRYEWIELSRTEKDIVSKQMVFSVDFFEKIAAEKHENFMVSPLSVSMAMSMLANGAQGETLDEIVNTLGFEGMDMDSVNTFNKRLVAELASADKSVKLSLANSIWIDSSFPVYESFISDNRNEYGAEIFNVELTTENTRRSINKWASDKTNGLIPEFLKTTLEDPSIFLMNALYFKGTWTEKFDKALTAEGDFYNADGTTGHPMMMKSAPDYPFIGGYDDNGASWASLWYGNGAYELVLILPDRNVTLADYLKVMDKKIIYDFTYGVWDACEGTIILPKFELSNELKLKDIMNSLGIRKAFVDGTADFSLISEKPLFLKDIKQDTRIMFSEEGTEAAAVTGVKGDGMCLPLPSTDLTFDRPFAFMIRESTTKSILFMGCVNKL